MDNFDHFLRVMSFSFVSEGVHVLRHATLADSWDGGRYPSDHMPVVADVALGGLR